MPKYTLQYFDVRARGEISRLLLTLKGQAFEDKRVSQEDWPKLKKDAPCGQLPVLTIDSKVYTESVAIERFLAREFGFYGANNQEGYEIDQVIGICHDLFQKGVKAFFEKDATAKAELQAAMEKEHIPRYVGDLETIMKNKGSKGFCVGSKLSLGDLYIYWIFDLMQAKEAAFSSAPLVAAIRKNVQTNPQIKAYLDKRKPTPI